MQRKLGCTQCLPREGWKALRKQNDKMTDLKKLNKQKKKKKYPILPSIMMHHIAMNTLILMKQWASMKWVV